MIFALHISVPECERSFDCKDDTKPYCNSKSICVGNLNLIIYDFFKRDVLNFECISSN